MFSTKRLAIAASFVLLLALLFIYFQTTTLPAQQNSAKTFDLIIKDKKLTSDPETISVMEGDSVTINIISDEDEELHLHGYDKSVDLEKDKPATLTFEANLTGHFPYELEKSKIEIGALEVSPE